MKTRNRTEYHISEKGLKLNRILFELTRFSLEELESSKLGKNVKDEMLKEYSKSLKIPNNILH